MSYTYSQRTYSPQGQPQYAPQASSSRQPPTYTTSMRTNSAEAAHAVLGYDTNGDGRLDAFDTNQVCYAAAQTPAVCELGNACTSGAHERGAGGQDGRMDTRAGAYDTTGDGRIDRCHISRPSVLARRRGRG